MAEMSTDEQRWEIFELYSHFTPSSVMASSVMAQLRADAARILRIDYLPDLRSLTHAQADELLAELRRALAQERVSDE